MAKPITPNPIMPTVVIYGFNEVAVNKALGFRLTMPASFGAKLSGAEMHQPS